MILLGIVAYLTGLWLGPFLSVFPLSLLGVLLSFGLFLTCVEQRGSLSRWGGLLLFTLTVVGVGHAHWASMVRVDSNLESLFGQGPVTLQGEIVSPVRQTPDGLILVVDAVRHLPHKEAQVVQGRIRVKWRDSDRGLVYGEKLEFTARLHEPYGTRNPGGFHYGDYLKRRGIHAVATLQGPEAIRVFKDEKFEIVGSVLGLFDQWRQTIHQGATATLSKPALGLFLGMILGEQSYIEQDIRDAFMASGTVHILSISGSHLGLLALLVFAGTRWLMRRLPTFWLERLSIHLTATRFAVLITLPVVSFYTLLAGAEMATIRSWIMIVVCCVGIWLGRERNLIMALAVAALLMVLPHPEAIHDISFQLSYLSVAAIGMVLLAGRPDESKIPKLRTTSVLDTPSWYGALWEKGKLAWLFTVAVSLTTLPLVAYHFHQIPWLGLVSNMIIVPLVGIFVIPIGLFSGIAVLVSGQEFLPLGDINQRVFDLLAQMVMGLSHVPGAVWHVASPSIGLMLLFWGILLAVVLLRHQPIIRWGGLTMLGLILVWWAWSPRTGWEPGTLRVTFLDVGQGDATVLELPDGRTVLIDGGPSYRRLDMGRAVIGPFLWNRGIQRLDVVVATHPQWDHVGGLPWVLQTFDVGEYWTNGVTRTKAFYQRLQATVQTLGLEERIARAGTEFLHSGPCSLTVLSPPRKGDQPLLVATIKSREANLNNQSLITRLECGVHSFLLMADAEQKVLNRLQYRTDGVSGRVVKIPHHGAKSSLHSGWVKKLNAEVTVVSVGSHNRYGHPAPEVIAAYEWRNVPVYRTDQEGAVWIRAFLDSPDLRVTTAHQQSLVPVHLNWQIFEGEWANWQRIWGS